MMMVAVWSIGRAACVLSGRRGRGGVVWLVVGAVWWFGAVWWLLVQLLVAGRLARREKE